jgi:hypothetical protein
MTSATHGAIQPECLHYPKAEGGVVGLIYNSISDIYDRIEISDVKIIFSAGMGPGCRDRPLAGMNSNGLMPAPERVQHG